MMRETRRSLRRMALGLLLLASAVAPIAGQRCSVRSQGAFASLPGDSLLAIEPRIMVVPFVRQGEDRRAIMEQDFDVRTAVTMVRAAFDESGIPTVDFVAATLTPCRACSPEAQDDQLRRIVLASGADVYVIVDYRLSRNGTLTASTLSLTAYETSGAISLGNAIARSPANLETSVDVHLEAAIGAAMPRLLDAMTAKWQDFVSRGKPIVLNIAVARDASLTLESLVGPARMRLADQIQDWLKCNAWRGYANVAGVSALQMSVPEVRIGVRDASGTQNFTADDFGRSLADFLRSIGVGATRTTQNSTLYLTLRASGGPR